MLTDKMKTILKADIRNFLYNGSLKLCHINKLSTVLEPGFKKKFYEVGVYNPLLYYLEQEGISFLGYGKISMTDHRLILPAKNNIRYYLYHKGVIENHKYNIKFFYSDATAMLFTLGFLQDVVKERVRGDDLVSKLSEKGAMKAWLGLQDTGCREMIKTIGCDRRVHK